MKSIFILLLFFLYSVSFSQSNDCGNNAGFELGNTNGWILKTGWYGAYGAGYSQANCPPTGTCPTPAPLFSTAYPGGAIPAATPLNGSLTGNIHQSLVNAAGGMDPNSNNTVPMLCPTGGNYSLRLGNNATAQLGYASGSDAEAARFTFNVSTSNAGFTYQYAFFVQSPGHAFESEPSFEVVVLDQNDSLIPCGRYFVTGPPTPAVAGNCISAGTFVAGNNQYIYQNWKSVGLDLTEYIGQKISIEFRTHDCFPTGGGSTSMSCDPTSLTCTYCVNGNCCTYALPQTSCTPKAGATCGYAAGVHSAYAYIDCYCSPLSIQAIQSSPFCTGAASIQICAPAGYTYSWPGGQPGIIGYPETQCVTVNHPVTGTTYTVNLLSSSGCPTKRTVILQGANANFSPSTICPGQSATLSASGGGTYSWNTGDTTSSIVIFPSATTVYSVTVSTSSCSATATGTVTVETNITASISAPVTLCAGSPVSITASGGQNYSWSSGQTTDTIYVVPTATATYSVIVSNGNCIADTASTTITVNPRPPTPIMYVNSYTISSSSPTGNQWYLNGTPINGATSKKYTITQNGIYMVCVTNANGCYACSKSDTTTTGVMEYNNYNDLNVSVIPNPGSGVFNLQMSKSEKVQVNIYSVYGECIHRYGSTNALPSSNFQIDLSSQPNGVYFVHIISDKERVIKKIIISK